jgi:hypothetical protein
VETHWAAAGLAFSGTLVIYNIDRLLDLKADQITSPARSRFVSAHRIQLSALSAVASAAALYCAVHAGWLTSAILLPVFGIGITHRRLKHFQSAKIAYIAVSWVCVVVGLPATLSPLTQQLPWVTLIMALTMTGNVIAFNVRDPKTDAGRITRVGLPRAISHARVCAALGVALGIFAPTPADRLIAIPTLTLLALLAYRPTERFAPVALYGALLVGALNTSVRFL